MDARATVALDRGFVGEGVLDRLGFGLIVTASDGSVLDANETARRLATPDGGGWPERPSCCSLLGCRAREPLADNCISELASRSDAALPEMRVDLPPGQPTNAVWVAAARTGEEGSSVVIHLRPALIGDRRQRTAPHWMAGPRLRIIALGRTRIETGETAIEGRWLMQRPGQLLKYLICQRGRPAHVDEIAYALWPKAGMTGRNSVRYFVHKLRDLLEPAREPRGSSSFIVSVKGTYALDPRVEVDLDEFERLALGGLREITRKSSPTIDAVAMLDQAIGLYRGDLFDEEPFAAWAYPERDRLRAIAHRSLDALVEHFRSRDDPGSALERLEPRADLWPLDTDMQRTLIALYAQAGRRSDARRRYAALSHRLRDEFGEEPDFDLADLQS